MRPRGGAAKFAALCAYIIVILVATPQAQQPVAFSGSPGAVVAGPPVTPADATDIDLLVGRSTVLNVGSSIARVSLTVPDVADAMVTSPQQLLIHGKQPGTISLFVWDRAGGIKKYEVNVRRDLSELAAQMTQLFPGEPITITGSGKDVVISGTVSSKYVVDKAAEVAGGYVEKKEDVVNLLKQQEGLASNQVMLRVRFAEVSRSALQELGASFVANAYKNDWFGRTTTGQFPAPQWDEDGKLVFSDFLNLFVLNTKEGLGAVIRALKTKGLFQSLAEPNLIALNGKEASFLAGGEYPYPVAQPSGNGTSITIQFKEFGVRLNFTPTVLANDLINLKVRPEVSSLDFSNAIVLNGFRIPALSTRRTETEVELQNGQTFAIAGLLNNNVNSTMTKIPGIGDIPILGWLFRSRAYQKQETELVVMITPTIVQRGSTGVSQGLPSPVEPWLGAPNRRMGPPAPYVGSPRHPATEGPSGNNDAPAPAPAASPAAPASSAAAPVKPAAATPAPAGPASSKPSSSASQMSAATPSSAKPMAISSAPKSSKSDAASSVMAVADAAAPAPSAPAATAATPVTRPMSKDEVKAIEEAREREREAAAKAAEKAEKERVEREKHEAEARKIAEEKAEKERKIAEEKAEKERERQEEIEKERAKKQAEIDKKNAEIARRREAEQEKREKALAEAAARLREAQAAYQAQLKAASKGGTNDQQTKK